MHFSTVELGRKSAFHATGRSDSIWMESQGEDKTKKMRIPIELGYHWRVKNLHGE
jgi:hypothetical protein